VDQFQDILEGFIKGDALDEIKHKWKFSKKLEAESVNDVQDLSAVLSVDSPGVLRMTVKKASLKNMPRYRQLFVFLEVGNELEQNYLYDQHFDDEHT